jgi:phosphatidylserine/phosphatidylglycerophosphate/cardiolipin synthase-like enzyme
MNHRTGFALLLITVFLAFSMSACSVLADLPLEEIVGTLDAYAATTQTAETPQPQETTAATQPPATEEMPQVERDSIRAYFTSSDGKEGENGVLEEAVLADINSAQKSIDMAMYNFSLKRVADALIAAKSRGVKVRVVTETDSIDGAQLVRLIKSGIKVIGDRHEGLMHNKFLIFDRKVVWMGSNNFTGSGTYVDNNNFLRFVSADMVENYTTEFEEMFVKDLFGADSPANTPHPEFEVAGVKLENYFAPEDHISPRLVKLVNSAQKNIDFMAYSFTSDPIGQAMLDRGKAGVKVRGVFDDQQYHSNQGSEYLRLKRAKMDVRLDGNSGLMHHKVIVIDNRLVIFGSYNFTASADKTNDENLVVLDDPQIAAQFKAEFEKVLSQAQK